MIENYAEEVDFPIPPELRQYIYATIKGETESPVQVVYPVHPIGFPVFLSVYNEIPTIYSNGERFDPNYRLMVNGQIDRDDIQIGIDGKFGQIAFLLSPTATYYLFHKPGTYFTNHCRDFKTILPIACKDWIGRLSQCELPEQHLPIMLEIVAVLSKNRLPPLDWLDTSVAAILSRNGKISQGALAEMAGVGSRHFRRKFKEIIGISPKYFCKIIQLNTIFEHLKSSNTDELHRLALDCGYYDQAHFINDFTRLIGSSPTHFLNGKHAYVQSYLGRRGHLL